MRGRTLGALLAISTTLVAVGPGTGPAGADPVEIGCDQAGDRVQITADAVLDASCTYTAGFDITASGVTLDCRGATIDAAVDQGIGILITTPADADLTGVTVTNCTIDGFLNNLRVRREGARQLPAGGEYDHATSDILLHGNEFRRSRGVGVYVDAYVSDVTITENHIHDTGSSGIYLEAGSHSNRIEGNELIHNGYTENGSQGQTFEVGGTTVWYWGTGREGISVDGSSRNVIRDNRFADNSFGGVLLYENCGEFEDSPGWFERRTAASGNVIEANRFERELNGVWVGSRMGENTYPMDCSDPAYVEGPALSVSLDHAPGNAIRANTFEDVTYGVRVEDDGTMVEGNRFQASSPDHHAVIIGTPYRTEVLDQPVTGTSLRGNDASITGNDSPYRWVHGEAETTLDRNSALGQPAGICEGEAPPRQVFVMVVAVAPALPDGSKPPTPDLTIDTLGALDSCQDAPSSTTSTTVPAGTAPGTADPAIAVPGTVRYTG